MTWNEQTRILRADADKWITDGDTYAIEAHLPLSVSPNSWRQVDNLPPEPNKSQDAENVEPLNL